MSSPFPLPLILDGATGSALQNRGMPAGVCTERWILDNPETLISLQREFIAAGSRAVYSPTFGCNRPTLAKYGAANLVREFCLRLTELSHAAASDSDEKILIGGDMSPCGLFIEPLGEHSFDEVTEIYAEQALALEDAGVDFFAVETQLSLTEARAAVTGIRSVSCKPLLVTFTCNDAGLSFFGETLPDAAALLYTMGIDAFGINCSGELELIARILGEISRSCALPLVAKPNAGTPKLENGTLIYSMTPIELARYVPALYNAGARIIGGCCGTTASHIFAVVEEIKRLAAPQDMKNG